MLLQIDSQMLLIIRIAWEDFKNLDAQVTLRITEIRMRGGGGGGKQAFVGFKASR